MFYSLALLPKANVISPSTLFAIANHSGPKFPRPSLQLASQELRPSQTKTPILPRVRRNADNQIRTGDAALLLEALRQRRVDSLLLSSIAALLENLDEDELVGAGEAEVGVLTDDLVGLVLGDDLCAG